jgi:glycosyltransferase involved in cell wall biosynthesis
MPAKPKIIFVHDNAGMYPLVRSLQSAFAGVIDFSTESFDTAASRPDLADCICWHVMGFYPKALPCRKSIHDYRSLSLGKLGWLKDIMKRVCNAKPDLRIIQPSISGRLGFNDGVPTVHMDVSISDSALRYRQSKSENYEFTYCYVGAMNAERRIDQVIQAFLRERAASERFLLIGSPPARLKDLFANEERVIFTGPMTQTEVFTTLRCCAVAVCFFPNHPPHTLQTPTKLLESAALGMRVLANTQPMNVEKAEQYGINAVWRGDHELFSHLPSVSDWPDNTELDPTPMLFGSHFQNCGLKVLLEDWLGIDLSPQLGRDAPA